MTQNDTEKPSGKPRIKFRLPRLGCFTLFFLVFFYVLIALVFLCRTTFPPKIDCETPTEHITLYDPCKVLREEDRDALAKLANEVAEAGNCDVALLFVNERDSSFQLLFDAVLYEWDTPKGVLLIYGLNDNRIKMALKGGEWRLGGHDGDSLKKALKAHDFLCRGGSAKILLDDLKGAMEKANRSGQPGTVKKDFSGVYYDSMEYSDASNSSGVIVFILSIPIFLFGLISLLASRDGLKEHIAKAPSVLAEFKRRHPNEPHLVLKDWSAPVAPSRPILHHPVLKVLAIVLGVYLGYLVNMAGINSEMLPDEEAAAEVYRQPDIPDAAPAHLLDLAEVFSTDEEAALAETIEHLERNVGGQVRILTVKQLDGIPLERYTLEVASKWKLGEEGKDNGALLFLAVKDRKNRIEVGYSWEGSLNDARCGDLLRDAVPLLRDKRYADACAKIIRGMESCLAGGPAANAGQAGTASSITVAPQITPVEPKFDPRRGNTTQAVFGLLGAIGSLLGVLLFYFGFVVESSAPHYEIIDPTKPKPKKTSGKGGSGGSSSHRSSSSSSSSSSSGGSSRRSGGGGGSFGGGGASGGW